MTSDFNLCLTLCTLHTVYDRIEARASISFQAILTRPLFEPGFYSSPASIKVHEIFLILALFPIQNQ